jgi:hypothetical protein
MAYSRRIRIGSQSYKDEHSVIVAGNFSEGGFAQTSWRDIQNIYEGGDIGGAEAANTNAAKEERVREPFLQPIALDDHGCAGSPTFRRQLQLIFRKLNVWGVISCCTARNSELLLEALEPIAVPILICVDNTVETAALSRPNLLQLIPNNALQAQAILSKVAAELPKNNKEYTVHVYCRRPEDKYVKDLWTALENKAKDSQNRRIRLKQVTVGGILQELCASLSPKDIVVYVGYRDGLRRLINSTCEPRPKLLLCDGCHEPGALELMKATGRPWDVAVPSFDPRVYAYQSYISLSEIWRKSFPSHSSFSIGERVLSLTSLLRAEVEPVWSYRFVGVANQSGGYILKHESPNNSNAAAANAT